MKKLIPAYILSFIICFMLFVMEPLTLFAVNRDDFNYNLRHFILPLILSFLLFFILFIIFYSVIYLINKKFSKKLTVYNTILIISYILFILCYIQGNFLSYNLPHLDGTVVNFNNYDIDNIISISIFLILLIIYIVCIIKFKFEKVINISKYISISIFIMFFTGFIPTIFNSNLYEERIIKNISNNNINQLSNNKNFIMILIDAVDSTQFEKILNEGKYNDTFNDFTYFRDTMSTYQFTRDSIPLILSGKVNYNKTSFPKFYNDAMNESPLIDKLIENNYEINIYDEDIKWNTDKSSIIKNTTDYDENISSFCYVKQHARFILFKYLPYFLKEYSNYETFNFNYCKKENDDNLFDDDNLTLLNVANKDIERIDNNYYSFIHIEGGHVPFDLDENLNRIENGTYKDKVLASLNVVDLYIKKLRENNLYDNSIIIVLADHGYAYEDGIARFNPILLIKGFDEHHKMTKSDKSIIQTDLIDAYPDLIDGKKSYELFPTIGSERIRNFIEYKYLSENNMYGYVTDGKAWEIDKYKYTGENYIR